MTHPTELLFRGSDASLGVCGPVVITATDGPASFEPAIVRRVVDEIARLRRTSHQNLLVYVYVAGERTALPSPEARAISAELGELFDACIGVHEGSGFRAGAVRAVVAGIAMMSRARVRPSIVSTIAEAATLVAARYPEAGAETALRRSIEHVREAARPG